MDPKDQYKKDKLDSIKQRIESLGEDVETEDEETGQAKEDIEDLEERLGEKPIEDLKTSEIQAFGKEAKSIKEKIDEVGGEVTDSEDELKKILDDLNSLEKKLGDDRRDEAEKAFKDASNHLDDLKRKLNHA